MNELEYDKEEPYWQHDLSIGEGVVDGEVTTIRLLVHSSTTTHHGGRDIIPLSQKQGSCVYVQASPYILVPEIAVEVALYANPVSLGEAGQVSESHWQGMRERPIGEAQAWCYPDDRLIVLWECYLFQNFSLPEPVKDQTLATAWAGFEAVLLTQPFAVEQIVTPSWENLYDLLQWQSFLKERGYHPHTSRAWVRKTSGEM
jgi:hypothetical protein